MMADHRPTNQIAAPSIRPYVQTLWHGAMALGFETRDETGRRLTLADDHLSGQYLLLVMIGDPDSDGVSP
jgi:hypothetical protein